MFQWNVTKNTNTWQRAVIELLQAPLYYEIQKKTTLKLNNMPAIMQNIPK